MPGPELYSFYTAQLLRRLRDGERRDHSRAWAKYQDGEGRFRPSAWSFGPPSHNIPLLAAAADGSPGALRFLDQVRSFDKEKGIFGAEFGAPVYTGATILAHVVARHQDWLEGALTWLALSCSSVSPPSYVRFRLSPTAQEGTLARWERRLRLRWCYAGERGSRTQVTPVASALASWLWGGDGDALDGLGDEVACWREAVAKGLFRREDWAWLGPLARGESFGGTRWPRALRAWLPRAGTQLLVRRFLDGGTEGVYFRPMNGNKPAVVFHGITPREDQLVFGGTWKGSGANQGTSVVINARPGQPWFYLVEGGGAQRTVVGGRRGSLLAVALSDGELRISRPVVGRLRLGIRRLFRRMGWTR